MAAPVAVRCLRSMHAPQSTEMQPASRLGARAAAWRSLPPAVASLLRLGSPALGIGASQARQNPVPRCKLLRPAWPCRSASALLPPCPPLVAQPLPCVPPPTSHTRATLSRPRSRPSISPLPSLNPNIQGAAACTLLPRGTPGCGSAAHTQLTRRSAHCSAHSTTSSSEYSPPLRTLVLPQDAHHISPPARLSRHLWGGAGGPRRGLVQGVGTVGAGHLGGARRKELGPAE